jgi:hypothetical protein
MFARRLKAVHWIALVPALAFISTSVVCTWAYSAPHKRMCRLS